MDLRQVPTEKDLAKMLDTICASADGGYPQTLHVLLWLIEQSPAAREIYDRLHARRDREPSLIELARLMIAVENGEPYPESVYVAHWLIQRSKKASGLYRQLEQMADDAGLNYRERNWAMEAMDASEELDRLLATLDDWQDAAQVIELKMQKDYAFQRLLLVCRARIARSRGQERARLERLRRRLQAAAEREIRATDPEIRLNELEGELRSMADPEAALATLETLSRNPRSEASPPLEQGRRAPRPPSARRQS